MGNSTTPQYQCHYLVTLYVPPSESPEFHVFSVNDLLAVDKPHIPVWLPSNIELKPTAG
jgi:hypothetical protein